MRIHARAVCIREPGDASVLDVTDVTARPPGHGEALIEVAAAGLNRADIMQRKGLYPAPHGAPADIPGLEYSGVISALGEAAGEWSVGDRVMAIASGGAMCTHLVAHHRELMRVPDGMSLTDAAAIPEVFLTAWDAIFLQAGAGLGDEVLVHAAASGVGTAALQLCLAAGVRVIGTARAERKLARLRSLGLRDAVLARDGLFADEVLALTHDRGVDVVLDCVGAQYVADNLRVLATRGRLVLLGLMGGAHAELSLAPILMKRLSVIGTVLRSRSFEDRCALTQGFARAVLPMFHRGALRPVVDAVLPMRDIREAHAQMERNDTVGKLVMSWHAG